MTFYFEHKKEIDFAVIAIVIAVIWIISIIEGNNIKTSKSILKTVEFLSGLSVLTLILVTTPIYGYLYLNVDHITDITVKNLFLIIALISGTNATTTFIRAYLTANQQGFNASLISWVNTAVQLYLTFLITILFLI